MAIGVTLLFVCGCLLAVSGEVTEQSPGLRLRRPVWTSDNFTRQSLQHLSSQLMQVVYNYLYTPRVLALLQDRVTHRVTHGVRLHLAMSFSISSKNHHFSGLVQPVGLVDYESLKKSIRQFLLFSRR